MNFIQSWRICTIRNHWDRVISRPNLYKVRLLSGWQVTCAITCYTHYEMGKLLSEILRIGRTEAGNKALRDFEEVNGIIRFICGIRKLGLILLLTWFTFSNIFLLLKGFCIDSTDFLFKYSYTVFLWACVFFIVDFPWDKSLVQQNRIIS